jgi:hypothetical protein
VTLLFSKNVYQASLGSYYTFYLIEKFGLSVQTAQFYLVAFLIGIVLGTLLGGWVGDRVGRIPVMWFSILGALPFALILPHANLFWTAVLAVTVAMIMASAFPAILVYAQELLPGRVGLVAGMFFGFSFGLGGLGAAALGKLADLTSIDTVYQVTPFLLCLGLLTAFLPRIPEGPRTCSSVRRRPWTLIADKVRRPLDSKPVSPSLFAHFVLRTANREPLKKWYQTVLKRAWCSRTTTSRSSPTTTSITASPSCRSRTQEGARRQLGPRARRLHLRRSRPAAVDLSAAEGEGIVPVRTINHGPTVSMYYKDPDGNQVELQVDAFDKAGAASYFHTEPFARTRSACCSTPTRCWPTTRRASPKRTCCAGPERARHALSRPGRELDGGATSRCTRSACRSRPSRCRSHKKENADRRSWRSIRPARCRPCWSTARRSPRWPAACSTSPSASPRRAAARGRDGRSAGGLVDVLHRLDPASGAPHGPGARHGGVDRGRAQARRSRLGARQLLDRRHSFVSSVLAHGQRPRPYPKGLRRLDALYERMMARPRAADPRDRKSHRLRTCRRRGNRKTSVAFL